jgi:predicted site-specific integrase-resolvase
MDKTQTKKELCLKYGISYKTLSRWLKRIDIETQGRRILSPAEVNKFENNYGKVNI